MPRLDDDQVRPILDFWRGLLRLKDWDIRVLWTDKDLKADFGYLSKAITTPHTPSLKAEITIDERRPWVITTDYWNPDNVEETLAHELIHLRLVAAESILEAILHLTEGYIPASVHPMLAQQLGDLRELYVETLTSILFRTVHPENDKPKES